MEYFRATFRKKGHADLIKLPEEGTALFVCDEPGGASARVIWSNHDEVSVGETWLLEVEDKPTPAPKVRASKNASKY